MPKYTSDSGDLEWRISRTCESGACIMIARQGDSVVFGNSTQPNGPTYAYTATEWKEFIAGVKLGDFDDIV